MLVPSEENVAQHEVLCAMVNNCSVLYLERVGVILRIRIHYKDRILIFVGSKQKMERKKKGTKSSLCPQKVQAYI